MWRGWGYQNMDHNISRLNIQLAPRLHPDLETFLSRASPCYASAQGHDSWLNPENIIWWHETFMQGRLVRTWHSSSDTQFITDPSYRIRILSQGSEGGIIHVSRVNRDYRLAIRVVTSCEDVAFWSQSQALIVIGDQRKFGWFRLKFYQRLHL